MQRLLITGGSGFLGRELALKLKSKYEVVLAARNNGLNKEAEEITGCKSIPMDVSNMHSVSDGFNLCKPNLVIHAGATKYVNISEEQPLETIDVNVLGSQNMKIRQTCLFLNIDFASRGGFVVLEQLAFFFLLGGEGYFLITYMP